MERNSDYSPFVNPKGVSVNSDVRPLYTALLITLIYFILSTLYIWFSDKITFYLSKNAANLVQLQTIKGGIFVLVTSLLIFALLYTAFRRISHNEHQIHRQQAALLKAERNAVAGMMASSVAHDINNILTVTMSSLELLKLKIELTSDRDKLFHQITAENQKLQQLAKRLQNAGREELEESSELLKVENLQVDLRNFASSHRAVKPHKFNVQSQGVSEVYAQPNILHQALYNLILNAGQAMQSSGKISVRISENTHNVHFEVHDSGPGISQEQRESIFQPYFTTKSFGTGLGLISVKSCAEVHNGQVRVENSDLGGACFRLEIPQWRS